MADTSTPVVEIAYLPINQSIPLAGNKTWEDILSIIKSQPGCVVTFWGRQIEHPDVVQLAIEWESMNAHIAFEASESYPPLLSTLSSLLSGPPDLTHALLAPGSLTNTPIATAPVTECISLFFSADYPAAKYEQSFATFCEGASGADVEATGLVGAWVVEESVRSGEAKEGVRVEEGGPPGEWKAKTFWVVVGWPSVDAHMRFRETEVFRRIRPALGEGVRELEVHHVAFTRA